MVIGFIGAGRTGCTIGKYLSGHTAIAGYYSRTRQSADDAAAFTQSKAFYSLEALIDSCDTVFITTPDRAISEVWECIRHYNLKDKIICHSIDRHASLNCKYDVYLLLDAYIGWTEQQDAPVLSIPEKIPDDNEPLK